MCASLTEIFIFKIQTKNIYFRAFFLFNDRDNYTKCENNDALINKVRLILLKTTEQKAISFKKKMVYFWCILMP